MGATAAIAGAVIASLGAVLGGAVISSQRPRRPEMIPVRVRSRRRRR